MTPEQCLAIPYVLVMQSVQRGDGEWIRQAAYPELPDCTAEAASATDAVEQVEQMRIRRIIDLLERGEPVPAPRAPLMGVRPPVGSV